MSYIFLSVPILDRPEFKMIHSMYQAILSCKEHKIRLFVNENDSLISRVRNVHMSMFLNEYKDCDYFVSLDSDLEIVNCYNTNNIFTKLLSHDKEFVGGVYALKQHASVPTSSSIPLNNVDRTQVPFDQGLLPMRWLSAGCWCLKRSAIEKMVESYPELTYVGDDNVTGKKIHGLYNPEIFEIEDKITKQKFNKYLSEDWSFPVDPETNVLCCGFRNKRIKDINIGDVVIAFDEFPLGQKRQLRFTKVENKIEKISHRIKITTENGEVITTPDHKWLIKRGYRLTSRKNRKNGFRLTNPNKSYWEQTKNLQIGDYIYKPFENINPTYSELYKQGYICGLWDGDGNIYKNKKWDSITLSLRMTDLDILEKCSEFLNDFHIENSIKNDINVNYFNFNPDTHSKLHGITICGDNAKKLNNLLFTKKIAIERKHKYKDFWIGYLAGIFDAEGHYDGATVDLCQYQEVNPDIWDNIKHALTLFNIDHKSDKRRHRITSCKNIHKFFILVTPFCYRKLHVNGQHKGKDNLIMPQYKDKIVKIEPLEEGKVICLVTETSTFIANGFASHNCERWEKIGGEIFADTSIVLRHIGKIPYSLWNVEVVAKRIEDGIPHTQPKIDIPSLKIEPQEQPQDQKAKVPSQDLPPAGWNLERR